MRRFLICLFGITVALAAQNEQPLFSFGVISDVQYADQPTMGVRAYRDSLAKLEQCSSALHRERLAFVIHLGDFVDKGPGNLDRILPLWDRLTTPRYQVLGNHDFVVPDKTLLASLKMPGPWYDFAVQSWRFVVLDGMNVSAAGRWPPSDPRAVTAAKILGSLKEAGARNAQTWNGAAGPEQREWLKSTLSDAAGKGQRAIVFCHFPVLSASCRPDHLLWDHAEIVSLLEASPATAAYMNGHDHRGGYASHNSIHYVTLPGMVEHDAASACKVMDVYRGKLVLRNAGQPAGQSLELTPRR